MRKQIIIGTRGSVLALWQARWVQSRLQEIHPTVRVELCIIKTKGDKILDVPLAMVGGKGLFVKEIETALLEQQIDLAVHSMKDMPSDIPDGLCLGAITRRENPQDVLISRKGQQLSELPENASIGTSSLRRSSQLLHHRPDLTIVPLRGNLDTRLKKLNTENLDAIVLAAAGVIRLGLENQITEYIHTDRMIPAVGQGALGIEIRSDDTDMISSISQLNDDQTHAAVSAERAFLHQLEGGCQVPIGAYARVENQTLCIQGMVAGLTGAPLLKHALTGEPAQAVQLGESLAAQLLKQGAKEILDNIYNR
ncbi:MAG: hydroxymethylbilane synthase [Candidatus Magnetomorum sp.]|nr:hydroxymethylbilane synthase [Candidatus Magnetomorum sp.]